MQKLVPEASLQGSPVGEMPLNLSFWIENLKHTNTLE